jgi:hypothetical protein
MIFYAKHGHGIQIDHRHQTFDGPGVRVVTGLLGIEAVSTGVAQVFFFGFRQVGNRKGLDGDAVCVMNIAPAQPMNEIRMGFDGPCHLGAFCRQNTGLHTDQVLPRFEPPFVQVDDRLKCFLCVPVEHNSESFPLYHISVSELPYGRFPRFLQPDLLKKGPRVKSAFPPDDPDRLLEFFTR